MTRNADGIASCHSTQHIQLLKTSINSILKTPLRTLQLTENTIQCGLQSGGWHWCKCHLCGPMQQCYHGWEEKQSLRVQWMPRLAGQRSFLPPPSPCLPAEPQDARRFSCIKHRSVDRVSGGPEWALLCCPNKTEVSPLSSSLRMEWNQILFVFGSQLSQVLKYRKYSINTDRLNSKMERWMNEFEI